MSSAQMAVCQVWASASFCLINALCNRRFALPALLPLITPDLHLTEQQGAFLTAGYAVGSYHSDCKCRLNLTSCTC